ncbi:hypothetical protein QBE52_09370 [Clostridiaceae bacterium 35-E11]
MIRTPNVVGFQLQEALDILKGLEMNTDIQETCSPKFQNKTGECRVINQINKQKVIELTISYF